MQTLAYDCFRLVVLNSFHTIKISLKRNQLVRIRKNRLSAHYPTPCKFCNGKTVAIRNKNEISRRTTVLYSVQKEEQSR